MTEDKLNVDYKESVMLELNGLQLASTNSIHNLHVLYEGMLKLIEKQQEVIREQHEIIKKYEVEE